MGSNEASFELPARYMARLVDFLESVRVDREAMLRAARIRSIDAPKARVTLQQVDALLRAAEHASGRTDLGFELGCRLDPTSHDILGFAMLTSPTFGHFVRLAVSYQRLIQPFFALSLFRRAGHVDLVYRPAVAMPHRVIRVIEEAIVLSNHVGYRSLLGDRLLPYEVWMSIDRPPHAQRYRELAGARVQFGEALPGVRIAVPAAMLDLPLAMANARAMEAAEERCKTMLRQMHARQRWSEWCRMMLRESEDSRPTLEQLAGIVNVSPRTLARYLAAEDTSFRDLSLQVRTARARELLARGELSVTQVAYRLGFTDVASFVRSFRGQTGRTPGSVVKRSRSRSL